MGLLSEFTYPTKWYSKLLISIAAMSVFALLTMAAASGYEIYKIVRPAQSHSKGNLQDFPGHPQPLSYSVPAAGLRDGWFFPGLKTAPTIILCPGYESNQEELVTLASALQDHQYNVVLFDFSAHGATGGRSTLGFEEAAELRAVVDAVAARGDVDDTRFGFWGANLGAYAALSEAIGDRRARAIALESVYDHPEKMVALLIARSGLGSIPLVTRLAQIEFRWITPQFRHVAPLEAGVAKLMGVAQLYLETADDPGLAESTRKLFEASADPHELVVLTHGNYAGMVDEEKRNYENRIVSFFLTNLPPAGAP